MTRSIMLGKTGLLLASLMSTMVHSATQPLSHSATQPLSHSATQPLSQNNPTIKSSPSFFSSSPILSVLYHGHVVAQLGGFWSDQGQAQQINISGLIGDYFNVTDGSDGNVLVGVGYYVAGPDIENFHIKYGINFFLLPSTSVKGTVLQEELFTNLFYNYNVTNYPLYFIAKSIFETRSPKYSVTVDAGLGPNFMVTSNFQENPLGANTIPDQIFSGTSTTNLSVTAGFGLKFNQFWGQHPLECGYRFFYLGQGNFKELTNQTPNTLKTGQGFANALLCSIQI